MLNFGIVKLLTNIRQINIFHRLFLAFPSSYLVQAGFNHVNNLLKKTRNRLHITNAVIYECYQLILDLNIKRILEKHQLQSSQ